MPLRIPVTSSFPDVSPPIEISCGTAVDSGPAIDGMDKGAGAAAGGAGGAAAGGAAGAVGVEVSGAVVGGVCATLVAVAPNIEAINAAASTRLSLEVFLMVEVVFLPCRLCEVKPGTRPRSACTLLRSERSVQLIFCFGTIRETLKRGIYGRNKQNLQTLKTKAKSKSRDVAKPKTQIIGIRFINLMFLVPLKEQ
jgi:hypothetical protein